jgi:hypothetical protein
MLANHGIPQVGLSGLPRCQIVSCQVRAVANEPHRTSRASGLQRRIRAPDHRPGHRGGDPACVAPPPPETFYAASWMGSTPRSWTPAERSLLNTTVAVSIFEYAFCAVSYLTLDAGFA